MEDQYPHLNKRRDISRRSRPIYSFWRADVSFTLRKASLRLKNQTDEDSTAAAARKRRMEKRNRYPFAETTASGAFDALGP